MSYILFSHNKLTKQETKSSRYEVVYPSSNTPFEPKIKYDFVPGAQPGFRREGGPFLDHNIKECPDVTPKKCE